MRFAIFVPAWDEAAVIGPMLTTLARAVRAGRTTASSSASIQTIPPRPRRRRTVADDAGAAGGRRHGPARPPRPTISTACGARCSPSGWRGRRGRSSTMRRMWCIRAELRVFAACWRNRTWCNCPCCRSSSAARRLLSGHYADEFAEAARQAAGGAHRASAPACRWRGPDARSATTLLDKVAAQRGGEPFDAAVAGRGLRDGPAPVADGRARLFARVREALADRWWRCARSFPGELDAAVRQKARWMTGIALAGWDRTGWAGPLALGDHWMRAARPARAAGDAGARRRVLAALAWGAGAVRALGGRTGRRRPCRRCSPAAAGGQHRMLLVWRWRCAMVFTGARLWLARSAVVGAALRRRQCRRAARRAARAGRCYIRSLRGTASVWDKTAHAFPDLRSGAREELSSPSKVKNGRPLRFLALVLGGWTAARVAMLWPAAAGSPLPASRTRSAAPLTLAERRPVSSHASKRRLAVTLDAVAHPMAIGSRLDANPTRPRERRHQQPIRRRHERRSLPEPERTARVGSQAGAGCAERYSPATMLAGAPPVATLAPTRRAWLDGSRPGGGDSLAFGQLGAIAGGAYG